MLLTLVRYIWVHFHMVPDVTEDLWACFAYAIWRDTMHVYHIFDYNGPSKVRTMRRWLDLYIHCYAKKVCVLQLFYCFFYYVGMYVFAYILMPHSIFIYLIATSQIVLYFFERHSLTPLLRRRSLDAFCWMTFMNVTSTLCNILWHYNSFAIHMDKNP